MIMYIIKGRPITKKNSQRVLRNHYTGSYFIAPSAAYEEYLQSAIVYLRPKRHNVINYPVNLKVLYYMPTHGKVDLCNLLAATCDILVHYRILSDDNCNIIVSHDGSRVLFDKKDPRAEIYIEEL